MSNCTESNVPAPAGLLGPVFSLKGLIDEA